jgi:hypothetical protein
MTRSRKDVAAIEIKNALKHRGSARARELMSDAGDYNELFDLFSWNGDLQGELEYALAAVLDENGYYYDRDNLEVLVDKACSNAFYVMAKTVEEGLDAAFDELPTSPTRRSKKKHVASSAQSRSPLRRKKR